MGHHGMISVLVAERRLREAAWAFAHQGPVRDAEDREGQRINRILLKAARIYAAAVAAQRLQVE